MRIDSKPHANALSNKEYRFMCNITNSLPSIACMWLAYNGYVSLFRWDTCISGLHLQHDIQWNTMTCNMYSVIPLALISTEDGVPYTVSIFVENSAGNGTVCNFTDFTNELCKFHSLSLMHVLCIKTPLCVWCRDGVNVLWWCSHLVWLVFEGSISTCICFHSENFFCDFEFIM